MCILYLRFCEIICCKALYLKRTTMPIIVFIVFIVFGVLMSKGYSPKFFSMEPELRCSAFRILDMIIWNQTFYVQWGVFLSPLYLLKILLSKLLFSKLLFFFVIILLSWGFLISCFFLFLFIILFSSFLVLGHLLHFPIFLD
jgi:hypothetical protein